MFSRVTEYRAQGVPGAGALRIAGQGLARSRQCLPVATQGNQNLAGFGVVVRFSGSQRRGLGEYLQGFFPLAVVRSNDGAEEPGIRVLRVLAQDVQAEGVRFPQATRSQSLFGFALQPRCGAAGGQKR